MTTTALAKKDVLLCDLKAQQYLVPRDGKPRDICRAINDVENLIARDDNADWMSKYAAATAALYTCALTKIQKYTDDLYKQWFDVPPMQAALASGYGGGLLIGNMIYYMPKKDIIAQAIDYTGNLYDRVQDAKQVFVDNTNPMAGAVGLMATQMLLSSVLPPYLSEIAYVGTFAKYAYNLGRGIYQTGKLKQTALPNVRFTDLLARVRLLMQQVKLVEADIRNGLARVAVAISSNARQTNVDRSDYFRRVESRLSTPLQYFLNYAELSYCLDESGTREKQEDCKFRWAEIDRRSQFISEFIPKRGDIGRIPYFVVYDVIMHVFVVSCRGTACPEDVITDILGEPVEFVHDKVRGMSHSQMAVVAENIANDVVATLKMPDYLSFSEQVPIVCTGHSLGAGVAALLSMKLYDRGYNSYAIGYATPAIVTPNIARRVQSRCISVVNESDIVPRLSERALCRLASENCAKIEFESALVCPGKVLWMTTVGDEPQFLQTDTNFMDTIIVHLDMIKHHSSGLYLSMLQKIHPGSPFGTVVVQANDLFEQIPRREHERLIIASLPPVAQEIFERKQKQLQQLIKEKSALQSGTIEKQLETARQERDRLADELQRLKPEHARFRALADKCGQKVRTQRPSMLTSVSTSGGVDAAADLLSPAAAIAVDLQQKDAQIKTLQEELQKIEERCINECNEYTEKLKAKWKEFLSTKDAPDDLLKELDSIALE